MTKHSTFTNEQPEMPVPGKKPEIEKPNDPKLPEIPEEDPQREPEEVPPNEIRSKNQNQFKDTMDI